VVYSLGDFTADRWSFLWCSVNLILACLIGITEKWITTKLKDVQTSAGIFFLRNMFSAVLIAPVSLWFWNQRLPQMDITQPQYFSSFDLTLIALSCVFGYLIGFSYFLLQRRTTPVSISVANCTYKLLTVVFAFFFFSTQFHFYFWIGLSLSFMGSFGYIYERSKGDHSSLSFTTLHMLVMVGLVTITGSTVIHYLKQNE